MAPEPGYIWLVVQPQRWSGRGRLGPPGGLGGAGMAGPRLLPWSFWRGGGRGRVRGSRLLRLRLLFRPP